MSLARGRSFDEIQLAAAKRFLHTAVVIDDRLVTDESPAGDVDGGERGRPQHVEEVVGLLELPEGALPPAPPDAPPGPAPGAAPRDALSAAPTAATDEPVRPEARAGEGKGDDADPATTQINVKLLADGFADFGLTCGILKPEGENFVVERIVAVASRADIVVLDWFLAENSGARAREALKALITARGAGRQLIAIYTTQRRLGAIADELREHLGVDDQDSADERDELVLDLGGIRIVLLNKGGVAALSTERSTQVSERELPALLVRRFTEMTSGLVPAVALNALGATRENAHRLLERLGATLDVGFGGHLLRLEHLEDGEQHLIDAMAGEVRAVIDDDAGVRAAAGEEGVAAWLDARAASSALSAPLDVIEELLEVNVGDPNADGAFRNKHGKEQGLKSEEEYSRLLAPPGGEGEARRSDADFAMLMSLRHRAPGAVIPTFRLGAILREDAQEGRYWLCVQPVCDAVRLRDVTRFPLLRLERWAHAETWRSFHFVCLG